MQIITVVPLTRARTPPELTYFSSGTPVVGQIITVPLRGRNIKALVLKIQSAGEAKAAIKSADFPLAKVKINQNKSARSLSPAFLKAAQRVADYFAQPLGLVIWRLLGANILARAQGPHFKDFTRPFLNYRLVAKIFNLSFSKKETGPDPQTKIEIKTSEPKPNWASLVDGRTLFYSARKGLAPTITCQDCGEAVRCQQCETPVILHEIDEKRFYLCHKCGQKAEPRDNCNSCGSWRLNLLGWGTESLKKELKKFKPVVIDQNNLKNKKLIKEKIKAPVLIGTEFVVPHITEKLDTLVVVGADTLLALPDYQINERLLEKLNLLTHRTKKLIVVTRQPDLPIFEALKTGASEKFRALELKEREKLGYPPFVVLVKVTFLGPLEKIKKDAVILAKKLTDGWSLTTRIFPGVPSRRGKNHRLNLILKIPRAAWPIPEVVALLRSLPPHTTVDVEPENLF